MKRETLPAIDHGEVLHRILNVLESIDAKLDRGLVQISGADRELLNVLLPVISEAMGSQRWTGAELFDHARRHDAELLVALDTTIGLDDSAVRRLGKLFSRTHGATLDGLKIERHEEMRGGLEWSVTRV